MTTLDLPEKKMNDEQAIREEVVTASRTLSPSINLNVSIPWYSDLMMELNHHAAVERARDRNFKFNCLRLHGVPVAADKTALNRQYVIPVFQTDVLAMYRSKNSYVWLANRSNRTRLPFHRVNMSEKSKEIQRAGRLAIRALYALGLDYGVVKIGVQPGGQLVVLDVIVQPRLNQEMENRFVHFIYLYGKQLSNAVKPVEKVMIGADPEFIMQSEEGSLVLASKYFPRYGRVGCDAVWHGANRADKPLVELRPKPSTNPRNLVVQMLQGMFYAAKKVNDASVRWLAGGMPYPGYPLGGHIHFSGVWLNFKLLRALDNYLALPLMLAEDPRGVKRRPNYGYLGDFRPQFHGGFEYRTLPSWLISPTLTKGVVALAQLIAAKYPYLRHDFLREYPVQKAYYQGNKEVIREKLTEIWTDLSCLSDYDRYRSDLDGFFNWIFSGKTWDESVDFRSRWKLPPFNRKRQSS
jgi:hypothetical protein